MEFEPRLSASRVLSLLLRTRQKEYRELSVFFLPNDLYLPHKIEGMEIHGKHLPEGHNLTKQTEPNTKYSELKSNNFQYLREFHYFT